MSYDVNWDVNKYREDHESHDQWQLRKAFLLRWKEEYPEERLVCLARVFTNMEFMGCRYPTEVMHEVARLSADIAKHYRNSKKTKLQRTFVSASDAAEDRARGVKREGGVIVEAPEKKTARIAFIPQGQKEEIENVDHESCADALLQRMQGSVHKIQSSQNSIPKELLQPKSIDNCMNSTSDIKEVNGITNNKKIIYMNDIYKMACLDPRDFTDDMLNTPYGKLVLVIRPWCDMISNLTSTCASMKIPLSQEYNNGRFTITLNNQVLVSVEGDKTAAKSGACRLAWDKLRQCCVILLIKEQWVQQNDARISLGDMSHGGHEFGEPIEESVALKMMKLMGWKGGGLGAESQGIAEPIKPNLRMIRRAGLGHETGQGQLKRAGLELMRRRGLTLDADLVFAADFTTEERAVLHQCASQCDLNSKSYGKGDDRFLVVSNKLRPLSLVRAVLECGGETRKYRVFIPATVSDGNDAREARR